MLRMTTPRMRDWARRLPALAAVGALTLLVLDAGPQPASAQSAYCERLRGDIAALDRSMPANRGAGSVAAIQRQRAELDRTVVYARSIGCQRQRFLMFGEPPPPQCGPLEAQINRMASNLEALESQQDRYGGGAVEAHRAALIAAYDTNCRGLQPTPAARAPGFLERLFGQPEDDPVTAETPPPPLDAFGVPGGSVKTLCVRKCDGYYFRSAPAPRATKTTRRSATPRARTPRSSSSSSLRAARPTRLSRSTGRPTLPCRTPSAIARPTTPRAPAGGRARAGRRR